MVGEIYAKECWLFVCRTFGEQDKWVDGHNMPEPQRQQPLCGLSLTNGTEEIDEKDRSAYRWTSSENSCAYYAKYAQLGPRGGRQPFL